MTQSNNFKEALERDLHTLRGMREEVRLQLELAKADAHDDWKLLERTWESVEAEIKRVGDHTKEPIKDMGAAARALMSELKHGYARIKSQLERAAGAHQ